MIFFYLAMIENEDDRKWLGGVFVNNKEWLLKVAYHYIKDETESQDVVQEIFCRMAKNINSVPRDSVVLKVYMETAVRNYCFTLLRKRNNTEIFSLDEHFCAESEENLEDSTINKVIKDDIINYIAGLPVKISSVLTMYFVCENKISDISDILGISYKTVESTLYRGRKMLKKRFKDLQI